MHFPWPVAALVALLLLLRLAGAAESARSPFTCSRTGPDVVLRQADLPPTVRAALPPYRMADPGQPWNVGDAVLDPELPFHRMICAYPDASGFVVEWEYGGIAHGRGRTAFRKAGDAYVPQ